MKPYCNIKTALYILIHRSMQNAEWIYDRCQIGAIRESVLLRMQDGKCISYITIQINEEHNMHYTSMRIGSCIIKQSVFYHTQYCKWCKITHWHHSSLLLLYSNKKGRTWLQLPACIRCSRKTRCQILCTMRLQCVSKILTPRRMLQKTWLIAEINLWTNSFQNL